MVGGACAGTCSSTRRAVTHGHAKGWRKLAVSGIWTAMSYSSLHRHASMVFDEVRNRAYLEAMRRVITPASIVLDVGAGVGVLGLLAAKLGARKVYCVEPSPVVDHIPA